MLEQITPVLLTHNEAPNLPRTLAALAWARENVRLALEEALMQAPDAGTLPGPADARAWLLLAACEAIAQEPPAAGVDRLRALLELTGQETDPL